MTSNQKQLLEGALKQIKSPSLWTKVTGLVTILVLAIQAYYDIRADVQSVREEAKEEIGQTKESIQQKGKLSEKETELAIMELQDKLQFIYTEVILLKDRVEDLELENKRLQARLERYRDLSGIPPEEAPKQDFYGFAMTLFPFLAGGSGGKDGVALVETESLPAMTSAVRYEEPVHVNAAGELQFDGYQKTW